MASKEKRKVRQVERRKRIRAVSSVHTGKEEARARSLERGAVHLLARRISPKKKLKKRKAEDDALLTDKKKRKRKPQAKKKSKPQPAGSAAHEADATVDEDGFAYSAVSFPCDVVPSYDRGTKEVQGEEDDGTSMILDLGCTKAMRSRHAYLLMRQGLSEGQVELLPDPSTFNFANGQKALARERERERGVQNLVLL